MKISKLNLLSSLSLAAVLVFAAGCPVDLSDTGAVEGGATAPVPAGACDIEVLTEGQGEVTIDCRDNGLFATLTAIAAADWRFDRWIGVGAAGNVATVAGDTDRPITAVFVSLFDNTPDGTIDDGNANDNGDALDDGNDNDNDNDNGNDNGNGNDNDNGADEDEDRVDLTVVGGLGSATYDRGELVTVSAVVPPGKQFDKWVGDVEFIESAGANCTVTPITKCTTIQVRMAASVSITATFVEAPGNASPPSIAVSIPAPQDPNVNFRTLFPGDQVVVTINAMINEENPQNDSIVLFLDDDNQLDPNESNQIVATTFSSVTSVTLSAEVLDPGELAYIGAAINDGVNATVVAYTTFRIRRTTLPQTFWLGNIDPPAGSTGSPLAGMILEGVQPEDNAGSIFAGGEDITGDGIKDLVVVARYGKPAFVNPTGVGIGEAYLIAGSSGRRVGTFNLNSVSSNLLPGVVFTGVKQINVTASNTDGMTAVLFVPDVDGDGDAELVFGVPLVDSAGRLAPFANNWLDREGQFNRGGVVIVSSETTTLQNLTTGSTIGLDQVGQRFLQEIRYGANFPVPEPENEPATHGDYGQDPCQQLSGGAFSMESPLPPVHGWYVDMQSFEEGEVADGDDLGECSSCTGTPSDPETDDFADTWIEPSFGFNAILAPPYPIDFIEFFSGACSAPIDCPANFSIPVNPITGLPTPPAETGCPNVALADGGCFALFDSQPGGFPAVSCNCAQSAECPLFSTDCPLPAPADQVCCFGDTLDLSIGSGYYPDRIYDPSDVQVSAASSLFNNPIDPRGARVIGRSVDDRFGTSVSMIRGNDPGEFFLVVSAPTRSGSIQETPGLGTLAAPPLEGVCPDTGSPCVIGVSGSCGDTGVCGTIPDSGVAYLFGHLNYWETSPNGHVPPKPHQYIVGERSHCGMPNPPFMTLEEGDVARPERRGEFFDAQNQLVRETPNASLTIVGRSGQNIRNVVGIPDSNSDGVPDIAVGAPRDDGDAGAVYLIYRRADEVEGDYILEKVTFDTNDPERLDGAFVRGHAQSAFGSSIAVDVDLSGDGVDDIIVGAPGADQNMGEVIIIFGGTDLSSPGGGLSVDALLAQGLGARIKGDPSQFFGNTFGGQFGFNVANAGDVDGDGKNDLLVSAPTSTPRFDNNPFDLNDGLTTFGLDLDHTGGSEADDLTGPQGIPDNVSDHRDRLENAGQVYLILGSNVVNGTINITEIGKPSLEGAIFVGRRGERTQNPGQFCTSAGNSCGDYLGGGDAGQLTFPDAPNGGNPIKNGKGRSRGLAGIGDIDNDGKDDFAIGAILADPRVDSTNPTGPGVKNGGEAYVIYGFKP